MKRYRIYLVINICVIVMFSLNTLAQPGDPPGGGGGGEVVGGAGVPLDGGVLSLLIAGFAMMIYRKFTNTKKE